MRRVDGKHLRVCARRALSPGGKQMAKDPVCGMDVDEQDAPSSEYNGETVYFCSEGCKTKFDADPASYAA